MCKHDWVKINDVRRCRKCGMNITHDGKVVFEKNRRKKNGKKRS